MTNLWRAAYEKADKVLFGLLPGGGTGNVFSDAVADTALGSGLVKASVIPNLPPNQRVEVTENPYSGAMYGGGGAMRDIPQKPPSNWNNKSELAKSVERNRNAKELNKAQQENERLSRASTGDKTETNQTNFYGPSTTSVKMCPINRDSHRLAVAAGANYRKRTQDTPQGGMMGCVESVQRTFDDSGLPRVEGAESWFRTHAGDTKELRRGLTDGKRGYRLPDINSAGPGDVVIMGGNHAGIVSDRKDADGNYLVHSNSGSHGSFSNVVPLVDQSKIENPWRRSTSFEVFRLGSPPEAAYTPKGTNTNTGYRETPPMISNY